MNVTRLVTVFAVLVGAVVAPAWAQLTVRVRDVNGNAVAGATLTLDQAGASTAAATDANGEADLTVSQGTGFTVTVRAAGFKGMRFSRTIPASAAWGAANVLLQRPAAGTSYLAQWRVGTTSPNEDPSQDKARFNFIVKYYRDGSAIAGATITLTNSDGSVYRTLTTDGNGAASCLVPEGSRMSVNISASGYVDYSLGLSPGDKATSRRVLVRLRQSV